MIHPRFPIFLSSLSHTRLLTKNVFYAFALIAIGFFIILPLVSLAIEPGLVPCGLSALHGFSGPATDICTVCDLFALIQNILNKSFTYFAMPIAALMLAWGGFTMVYGSMDGSPQGMQKGKKIIVNAAVGLLIVFASWLIVDTVLKAVGALQPGSGFGPWNEIQCKAAPPVPSTHKACVDGQCKEGVPGSGADRCTEDKNCADPPVHNECKDQACQEVSGSDVNRCTEGTDECVEGLCKGKPGTPGESCPDAGYNTCKPATVSAEGDCAKSKVNSWQAQITEGISKVSICGVDTEKLVKAIIASESSGIITKENNGHCGLMQLSPNDVRNYAPKCKLPSSPNLKSTDVTCDWLKKTENAAASICLGANYLQFFASTQCGNLRNIAAGFNGGSSALSESANCGSGSGKCQVCPGQSWNTKRWECLWEDNEHSICNASRTSGSYQETRKYVPKVWGCYNQF